MQYRELAKEEIVLLKEIDRKEVISSEYYMNNGKLELREAFYDVKGWDKEELNSLIDRLNVLYDKGGVLIGAFDGPKITGMTALDSKFIGSKKDTLKLDILYTSSSYRGMGIGKKLMELAAEEARRIGAKKLYISATPTKGTVDFYISLGSKPAEEVNEELIKLEPDDIHLELQI